MKQLTAEECIARILKDIDKRRTVEYDDKNSVRRYNAAMDRIVERANYLCDNYPDKMGLLTELLSHSDYSIVATCTSVLFGLHSATKEHKLTALNSARQLLLRVPVGSLAEFRWKVNIERWEKSMRE